METNGRHDGAERALRESEARLSGIIASALDAILTVDAEERVTVFNAAAERMFGCTAIEALGQNLDRFIPARFPSLQSEEIRTLSETQALHSSTGAPGILSGRRADGTEFPIEASISQVDTGGQSFHTVILRDITERKKSEEANRRFVDIVESSDDAIISKTIDGIITSWNPAAGVMFGWSAAEAIGQPMTLLFPHDHMAEEGSILEKIGRGEHIHNFETVRLRKDGTLFDVSVTISPVKNAAGETVGASKIVRDITAEKKIRQQLTLLQAAVSNLNDIILITTSEPLDEPGPPIVFVNDAIDRISGYTVAETLGRSPRFLQGPNTDPVVLQEIRQALGERKPIRRQLINYAKDGSEHLLDIDIVPIFDGENRCTHFAAIQRDVTELNRGIERIAEQAALLDKAQDAILVRDLEGNVLFWNKGAERMYGWTSAEALGRNISAMIYDDPEKFRAANQLTLAQEEWSGELEHITREGTELTVEARWTLLRDQDGNAKSVLAIDTNITEKKKIEAQFMRAQRMESIGTLAGGIAHDLNNILTPIMMSIGILKETANSPATMEILNTIEVSTRRGADIVRQVLSFARGLEGQRVEIQPTHLIKDIEHIFRDTFPKNIQLEVKAPSGTWVVLGDPTQLHQILLNLCVNARDAMPEGGRLSIHVENRLIDDQYAAMTQHAKAGPYVIITVQDSGTGIPDGIIDQIFDPFFTTKEIGRGTGLGLSTVMAIVKSHDGFINVYSEPEKGTTFKICLPAEPNSQGPIESAPQVALPRGNGETILVVDDEPSILTITSQTLQAFGYRVLTATNGAEAVAVYVQHRQAIAVVLTDMMMPVMDGPATIHALLMINPAVRIVTASGLTSNGGVAKAAGVGVRHFLMKPYTAGALLKILKEILAPLPVEKDASGSTEPGTPP